jgi:hypothetical protein
VSWSKGMVTPEQHRRTGEWLAPTTSMAGGLSAALSVVARVRGRGGIIAAATDLADPRLSFGARSGTRMAALSADGSV